MSPEAPRFNHCTNRSASIRPSSSSATTTANGEGAQDDTQTAPASTITQEQSTQDVAKAEAPKQENTEALKPHTKVLDNYLGVENMNKAKELSRSTRQLSYELNQIYGRQRVLRRYLKGPYRVRVGTKSFISARRPEFRDNRLFVDATPIPNIWLRDNCQCGSCMHNATKQRLLDTFSIPKDISIKSHSIEGEGADPTFKIEWSDGHESAYSRTWLSQITNAEDYKAIQRRGLSDIKLWDATIASNPPIDECHHVMNNGLTSLLRKIRRYGFCFVDGTPFKHASDTKKLLEKISFIRETHYGGFYDFTADLASKDTAYTNIALEAHTDTTYFSDPAGLQAFHLLSHTDGEGGASLLVDGFKAADELNQTDRKAYEVLSTVNVHAHASGNEGISIQPYRGFPVLEHDPATGDLLRVRWNSSDRARIEMPIEQVETWYDAARKFDAILKKKENEYWEQLVPGRLLIFDNWRVLHGRSSFTGKRRICGGYINRDDWISKFKMGEFGSGEVLKGLAVN
ncbi:trimethyllysine dioxygenase [Alternaria panax]|uniref:Trimethyllysine dioxygenase n=1 Tax=Alternaria panax TaxID=48097 RepID=A0AAD4NTL2_9PLEO|nr:trimethyllysine dioxygenase [Alternaria panax]